MEVTGRWVLSRPLSYQLALACFWPPVAGEEKNDLAVLFTKGAAVPTPLTPHEQTAHQEPGYPGKASHACVDGGSNEWVVGF